MKKLMNYIGAALAVVFVAFTGCFAASIDLTGVQLASDCYKELAKYFIADSGVMQSIGDVAASIKSVEEKVKTFKDAEKTTITSFITSLWTKVSGKSDKWHAEESFKMWMQFMITDAISNKTDKGAVSDGKYDDLKKLFNDVITGNNSAVEAFQSAVITAFKIENVIGKDAILSFLGNGKQNFSEYFQNFLKNNAMILGNLQIFCAKDKGIERKTEYVKKMKEETTEATEYREKNIKGGFWDTIVTGFEKIYSAVMGKSSEAAKNIDL